MDKAHLGILVRYLSSKQNPPFLEKIYFKNVTIYAQKIGMNVTVFSPLTIDWKNKSVLGYRYDISKKQWKKGNYPVPHVLYDRIAYSTRSQIQRYHRMIKRLIREFNSSLLGKGLPGKWNVYNLIKDIPEIQPFLPETTLFDSKENWTAKLKQHGSLFFKPASGSHGKGVFKVEQSNQQILIQGRTKANRIFHKSFSSSRLAHSWMKDFIGLRKYIHQPYLELSSANSYPFDIRILCQKDNRGSWTETGRAARVGKKGSVTSNIDGGGTAVDASEFLSKQYSAKQIGQINEDMHTILTHLPQKLEERHGQLVELGIDIGIDRSGHVWILEVNSKPGRESFKLAQNHNVYRSAISAPVDYAKHVMLQSGGNSV